MRHIFILLVCSILINCGENDLDDSGLTIEQYLERNEITEFEQTDSGLIYTVNTIGEGDFPIPGNTVTVHYTGYHLNDTKFDTSFGGAAFSFELGRGEVIAGWEEGIALFKKGGSGTLYIPWELGYGESGAGSISPKEDLKFDINIIAID
ncbi:MAG: FKBP-type peptidyl-prolyl cis-trans isomerase [Reichenbachiella sp.]|uniref:FKBP-type peptidyl-prolyl cis-trans isomerase n=1 Tax=Reichenbachiella sp. TaxID=2184521 RepID=UPI0032975DB1